MMSLQTVWLGTRCCSCQLRLYCASSAVGSDRQTLHSAALLVRWKSQADGEQSDSSRREYSKTLKSVWKKNETKKRENLKSSSRSCNHGVDASVVERRRKKKSDGDTKEEEKLNWPIAQERLEGNRIRKYWVDEETGRVSVEEHNADDPVGGRRSRGGEILGKFVLPAGFPETVSPDYLNYILWQIPTNVTGWICSTLVTSSLFKAVGIGEDGGGTYAAAATATIKWVSKDGLGAVGQFIVGGRFGSIFDEDPKQWRMYADVIGSAGSIFELCTPLAPDKFLLLASLGHLTKAVAKGLKDPSFRVIQNHFAIQDNVGDVSAKEEVWEVAAKLVGLAIAVLMLSWPALGLSTSYTKLVLTWISLRTLHLFLRHQSLSVVQLETINYKRAALLIRAHLEGRKPLPGFVECNQKEQLLIPWQCMLPRIRVGCSLQDIINLHSTTTTSSSARIQDLLKLYSSEKYVLTVCRQEARILMKEGASTTSILRSLWQAYWLFSSTTPASTSNENDDDDDEIARLGASLDALELNFGSFVTELEFSGWSLDRIAIKVPTTAPVILQSS